VYPYKCGFIVICGLLKNAKTADNTDVGVVEHSSKSQQTGYGGGLSIFVAFCMRKGAQNEPKKCTCD